MKCSLLFVLNTEGVADAGVEVADSRACEVHVALEAEAADVVRRVEGFELPRLDHRERLPHTHPSFLWASVCRRARAQ